MVAQLYAQAALAWQHSISNLMVNYYIETLD